MNKKVIAAIVSKADVVGLQRVSSWTASVSSNESVSGGDATQRNKQLQAQLAVKELEKQELAQRLAEAKRRERQANDRLRALSGVVRSPGGLGRGALSPGPRRYRARRTSVLTPQRGDGRSDTPDPRKKDRSAKKRELGQTLGLFSPTPFSPDRSVKRKKELTLSESAIEIFSESGQIDHLSGAAFCAKFNEFALKPESSEEAHLSIQNFKRGLERIDSRTVVGVNLLVTNIDMIFRQLSDDALHWHLPDQPSLFQVVAQACQPIVQAVIENPVSAHDRLDCLVKFNAFLQPAALVQLQGALIAQLKDQSFYGLYIAEALVSNRPDIAQNAGFLPAEEARVVFVDGQNLMIQLLSHDRRAGAVNQHLLRVGIVQQIAAFKQYLVAQAPSDATAALIKRCNDALSHAISAYQAHTRFCRISHDESIKIAQQALN